MEDKSKEATQTPEVEETEEVGTYRNRQMTPTGKNPEGTKDHGKHR